jgi:outer membrane lipoprotein-sorting protein
MVSICAALALIGGVATGSEDVTRLSDADRDAVVTRFAALQRETRTYRADLKQTVRLRGLREPVVSEGAVYYRRPDALAFVFATPSDEFFIVNGADTWLKKRNKPVQHRRIDPSDGASAGDMRYLLSVFQDGGGKAHERFEVEIARSGGTLRVVLTPIERHPRSREPVKIENWVDAESLELRGMRVEFPGNNAIEYEFANPRRNGEIAKNVFEPQEETGTNFSPRRNGDVENSHE